MKKRKNLTIILFLSMLLSSLMNVAMTKTIGEYMVNSALCLKFINPWVYAGCLAFCSAVLISDVYEINESYKDCLANCVN